ncbi:flagellar hook protein FlgE [Pseudomonas sp. S5(2021)]|nr:flagellar hook protein FlgE [Pseudomonas sp. S5(2021)]
MSFNIGLSGMRAASKDLNVTGNNIANAGTVGFKQSRAEFSDVYAASVLGTGQNPQGSGVLLSNVSQQFNQGNINYTQNALDLAINGNGFFQVSNNGAISYTRAGYFGTDREGNLVDNFGYNLQGYSVDANGNLQNGVVSNLQVQTTNQAPRATSQAEIAFNLNSTNAVPAAWQNAYDAYELNPVPGYDSAADYASSTFDAADPTTYNSSTSLNIYDSQGNAHVLTQYFVKTGDNEWAMNVLVDGRNPNDPDSPGAEIYPLAFTSTGQLVKPNGQLDANGVFTFPWSTGNGADAPDIQLNLGSATQYASSFAVNSVAQDGYTTGELAGLEIDETGVIFARYTNGQSRVQGQLVLANFANVQGLTPVGKSQWIQSFESGEPVVGTPGSGTLGALQAGALEDSNVEISDQLVNLIVAQRNYQANAKTIETESAITQTIINLR